MQVLAQKDVGEIIIRPSSQGPTHLSVTLKFYDGVYTHIDILEGGKDSKDVRSFLSLGKTLKIGEETFEDLDEVRNMKLVSV
jgi:transcription elongation factor SPT6